MTGLVQTSLEKAGPRKPVLSESKSDSSDDHKHELTTADRARTVFPKLSVFISIYVSICVFHGPLRKAVCMFILHEEVILHHNCAFFDTSGCRIPNEPNDTFAIQSSSHSYLVNTTIPKLDDGTYDQCHIIVNDSKTTCDEWVFDYSVFTNTINSQVTLILFNLVCEKKLSNSHAIATYFMGQMSAPFVMMPFGDIQMKTVPTDELEPQPTF
ncbi:hypothetical protein FSP39_022359 [Pinctada imbricata]|uniref:Uncharacterized protein n=1 Tax=Pinctada imbricata TaxID=66713 RepID=A0AA89C4A3_PINIB|nr:hypothetical protein FSP39_022359 [Pinctada imbricata]